MISRPMHAAPPPPELGHCDEPMQPLSYHETLGPHGGYPAPIRRTKSFGFRPRFLPPVNKVVGSPRL